MLDRLVSQIRGLQDASPKPRPVAPIPLAVRGRLHPGNPTEPLFPKLRACGKGGPGVTQERAGWWVIRDNRGGVVGGAKVGDMGPNHPVTIDVAVDPRRQGEGWASRLYEALDLRGIDMEAGSAASLAHATMSPDGYQFMRARRMKFDPDAEIKIAAEANLCPGCGPMDDHGSPIDGDADSAAT